MRGLSLKMIVFLCAFALVSCAGQREHPVVDVDHGGEASAEVGVGQEASENNIGAYRIGAGDKIEITVYGEDDLSKTYAVDNVGYISFPLIGSLHVDGITLSQLEERIREKLMDGYLKDPSVSAQMAEFRPFYILGEVRVPGSYNYVADMSVLNAVALAGGYTYRADQDIAEIMKGGKTHVTSGKDRAVRRVDPEQYLVRPGDIILIKERFF